MVGNKIEINGNVIEMFSSYETLPMERFRKFNKFILKDSDIGSDVASFVTRIQKAIDYIDCDAKGEAVQELSNLSYTIISMFNDYSLSQNAFACMVKSINGVTKDDLTEDGLASTIEELNKLGITQQIIASTNEALKKK